MTTILGPDYAELDVQLKALVGGETDALANAANFVALLYNGMRDVNWVGIYVLRGDDLVLGPFQGKPACLRIPVGSGVCGTAAAERKTVRVDDVNAFPGHIVCDPDSRSEIVVPLESGDRLLGVLDIDSPLAARFDDRDQDGVERLCGSYLASLTTRDGVLAFI